MDSDQSEASRLNECVAITIHHRSKPYTFELAATATISDLSRKVADALSVPVSNQKFTVSGLGLLKPPFPDPSLLVASLAEKKITLIGATTAEASSIKQTSIDAARYVNPRSKRNPVQAYKTRDRKKESEEAAYTFHTLRPLEYLPNPARSLAFLQRLKDDAGIKAAMRMHKFSVPLLTEMNPAEHTASNHEGTSRTLGLNRNQGEVIELRLRTDAYDGYRDYKTIRRTLCHELAHCVFGPHDRDFWNLCHQIEKEVDGGDWRSGGRSVGNDEYYDNGKNEEVHDHGGWTGGEYVLGASPADAANPGATSLMTRRDVLAKAAEDRMAKKASEEGNAEPSS